MKKRLRKKFYIGEFQEMGFKLGFHCTAATEDDTDKLIEDLIHVVELMGLVLCGGGSYSDMQFSFYVSHDGRGTVEAKDRQVLLDWLAGRTDVDGIKAGELQDAWYD